MNGKERTQHYVLYAIAFLGVIASLAYAGSVEDRFDDFKADQGDTNRRVARNTGNIRVLSLKNKESIKKNVPKVKRLTETVFGKPGTPGSPGTPGQSVRGETGLRGFRGATGARGIATVGPQGPFGPIGDTGATGQTGATGPVGPKGDKGDTGADGAPGEDGAPGVDGAPGMNGSPPASFTFTVGLVTYVCTDPDGDLAYDCQPTP